MKVFTKAAITIVRSPSGLAQKSDQYLVFGSTAIARFAGNVHGVVVQIAMLTAYPLLNGFRYLSGEAEI